MKELRSGSPSSEVLSDGMDSLSIRDKTLLKRSVSKHHNNNFKAGYVPVHEQYLPKTGLRGRKTFAFWMLVFLLLILAVGNLILTVIIFGVLRLSQGMQSLELVPEEYAIKFFGNTNLGHIYKLDGKIEGFQDLPVEITGDNGSIYFNFASRNDRPINKLQMDREGTYFRNVKKLEIKNQEQGESIFSTSAPNFNIASNLNQLDTKMVESNRIVSAYTENLTINSKLLNIKGAEGTRMEGRDIVWKADQDIYLKSINGSLVLSGKEGVFVNLKRFPMAKPKHNDFHSDHYKMCVCMPEGKLFLVPVPSNPSVRIYCHQINMSPQYNPCM